MFTNVYVFAYFINKIESDIPCWAQCPSNHDIVHIKPNWYEAAAIGRVPFLELFTRPEWAPSWCVFKYAAGETKLFFTDRIKSLQVRGRPQKQTLLICRHWYCFYLCDIMKPAVYTLQLWSFHIGFRILNPNHKTCLLLGLSFFLFAPCLLLCPFMLLSLSF